jgi:hypothetical protein
MTINLGSIHPLDTGFDVRAVDMPIKLAMRPGERYWIKHAEGIAEGTAEEICRELAALEYIVEVTPPLVEREPGRAATGRGIPHPPIHGQPGRREPGPINHQYHHRRPDDCFLLAVVACQGVRLRCLHRDGDANRFEGPSKWHQIHGSGYDSDRFGLFSSLSEGAPESRPGRVLQPVPPGRTGSVV